MPSEHLKQILASLPMPKKPGRPKKLDAIMLDKLCRLIGEGRSLKSVSKLVGVHRATIYEWRATDPGCYHATENARRRAVKAGFRDWEKMAR